MRSLVGTPNYIAPEVFQRYLYGKECDWFDDNRVDAMIYSN